MREQVVDHDAALRELTKYLLVSVGAPILRSRVTNLIMVRFELRKVAGTRFEPRAAVHKLSATGSAESMSGCPEGSK
ncbi:hypothetical protein D3C86_1705820 [compost metagenome]